MSALVLVATILQVLDAALTAGINIQGQLGELATQVSAMQAANRDPTPEEWAALNASVTGLLAQMAAVPVQGTPPATRPAS